MPTFLEVTDTAAARTAISAERAAVFNALDYGVVADGSTDNATALGSAISAASAAGGGVVLMPVGTVKVNSSVAMAANVKLRGHGWDSVIKLGAVVPGSGVITIGTGADNVVIENLKIDGNRASFSAADTSSGILGSTGGYENVLVRNVWVTGCAYNGITFLGSSSRANTTRGVRIVDCLGDDMGASPILIQDGVDNVLISHCVVRDFGLGPVGGVGITVGRGSYDVSVTDCVVDGDGNLHASGHGISLDTVLDGVVCRGNLVRDCTGYGIEVGHVRNGVVDGNTIIGGDRAAIALTGSLLAGTFAPRTNEGVTVSGNVIDGTANSGIAVIYNDSTSGQDCPASVTVKRSTAYTAATTTRTVDSRRLYECTTSGTTAASKAAGWGTTATGDTVTDGTSVWTDRGSTNHDVTISGNSIRNVGDVGIYLAYVHRVTVTGNVIVNAGESGIQCEKTANIITITGNLVEGCNNTSTAGHAGIFINAYTGAPHVARVSNNRIADSGVGDYIVTESSGAVRIDDRLQANSATSSVAFATLFRTANTTSTTITGLSDANAVEGRIITVHVNDANTTFQHSASGTNTLRLNGSINYAAPLGTMVTFAWSQVYKQWFELSRSSF